jgi:predicted branched-subunit amino acid permease
MTDIVFTWAGTRRGFRRAVPLTLGMVPFGLVGGVLSQAAGLSFAEEVVMAALVFSGAAQVLVLGNWGQPAPVLGATLASFTVSLRLLLMGPVLGAWLDRLRGWRLLASLFFMADHNWALSVTDLRSGGRDAAFLLGSGLLIWAGWVVSNLAGFALGSVVQPPAGHPIYFTALAAFIALLVPMWRGRREILPWAVAAATALSVHWAIPGGTWHIAVAAVAGSATGVLRDRFLSRPPA